MMGSYGRKHPKRRRFTVDWRGGDIVLRFQSEEGQLLRARVFLPPDAYAKACDAHKLAHLVSVRGLLKRAPRVSRIETPSEFKDLTLRE